MNGCVCWRIRGVDPLKLEQELPESGVSLRTLIARTRNSWHANKGEYDFSHEVKEAMSGCLACKACSTQRPIKIDVPEFRSRFLQLYHTRYLRPLRDHLVATVESYAPLMARAPKIFNFFINQPLMRKLSENISAWLICRCCRSPRYNNKWWASLGKHDAGTA